MARGTHSFRSTLGAFALAAWAGSAGAADLPEPVKKLSGSSEEAARNVMTQQSYVLRNEKTSRGRDYGYWWSEKRRECVQLTSLGGRVLQVQAKGASDCKAGAIAAPPGAPAPGAALDPMTLAGQPRGTADERLVRAGFRAVEADMRVEGTIYLTWTDGRRCLAATIVNDRYERVDELSKQGCYIK